MSEQETGQRQRVAAILAADVVGYSRLMADDETATIAALDAARAVFAEHIAANQGRVVDTAGDSVLAIFETTAGAVEAAMAVQTALAEAAEDVPEARRMRFRIGVHLGDIHEKADGTIYGDGVNIAARLEGLAERGTVAVSDAVQATIRGRVSFGFADLGEHEVKNIEHPVRAYRVLAEGERAPVRHKRPYHWGPASLIPLAIVMIVTVIAAWPDLEPAPDEPVIPATSDRPVIAVLPFDNLAQDPEQDFFVDGLTEEIIGALSRFRHLAVLGRNSTFRYKGQAVDVTAIGSELGARYIVEGSIRRAADTIRIIARLIDTETEAQLWSETFERSLTPENIFAIQDEVSARIAATVGDSQGVIGIAAMDALRRASPANLASYDCVLRATEYMRGFSDALRQPAKTCLENTVRSDPDYALGWSWLAEIYLDEYRRGLDPEQGLIDKALNAANTAVKLAPNDGHAHYALANAFYYSDNLDAFSQAAERALELNPYSADSLLNLGHRFAYAGEWEKGLALIDRAIAMQGLYPAIGNFAAYFHHYDQRDYETALDHARRMNMPDYVWAQAALAAAYGQLGRSEEAAPVIARMLELRPDIAETARADRAKFFRYQPELLDHFMDGLRKAGLNIPEAPEG